MNDSRKNKLNENIIISGGFSVNRVFFLVDWRQLGKIYGRRRWHLLFLEHIAQEI
jgi:hypothetical protein